MEFFIFILGMIFFVWMRVIVRIFMFVGGIEVFIDYGKYDLVYTFL